MVQVAHSGVYCPRPSSKARLELLPRTPDMDDGQWKSLGLVGQLITEDLTKQGVDNRMEAFLTKPVTVLF